LRKISENIKFPENLQPYVKLSWLENPCSRPLCFGKWFWLVK